MDFATLAVAAGGNDYLPPSVASHGCGTPTRPRTERCTTKLLEKWI